MKDISLLGGKIIGNPQLSLKRLPENVVTKLQKEVNNKILIQQQKLKRLPQEVYQQCLELYSKQHPDLHLDKTTSMKALQFYGLKNVIKEIKQTQHEVISQAKQKCIDSNTKVSDLQYYMKITYKMSSQIYKDSKKYL